MKVSEKIYKSIEEIRFLNFSAANFLYKKERRIERWLPIVEMTIQLITDIKLCIFEVQLQRVMGTRQIDNLSKILKDFDDYELRTRDNKLILKLEVSYYD